ncbi:MAG: hypothetical protein ABFR75_01815 [Acidobacteriota bacterium]
MLNKISLLFPFVLLFSFLSFGEIIKISNLEKYDKDKYTFKRDIFSPQSSLAKNPRIKEFLNKTRNKVIEKKEEIKEDINSTIVYEGFLSKKGKTLAMLAINGEFFIVSEGGRLQNRILIKSINSKNIIIEVESKDISIRKKGVSDEYKKINL